MTDELGASLLFMGFFTLFGTVATFWPLTTISALHASRSRRWLVVLLWVIGLTLVHVVATAAAPAMLGARFGYVALCDAAALVWMPFGVWVLHSVGLSLHDDVIERRNDSAFAAIAGVLVALAIVVAGAAGMGGPPGRRVFAAAVATLGLAIALGLLEAGARVLPSITVDRDLATGVRVGGTALACAVVLAAAEPGAPRLLDGSVGPFASAAWPLLPAAAAMIVIERSFRLTPKQPRGAVRPAVLTAAVYVGAAIAWAVARGTAT
jgi:hypothetical protein